jgi:hypothetical protein
MAVLKSSAEITMAVRIKIKINSTLDIFSKKERNKTKTVAVK